MRYCQAVQSDPRYAPALYRSYVYQFYRDPARALEYFNRYLANANATLQNEYQLADLYFLNHAFDKAISKSEDSLKEHGPDRRPGLYKLMAYSHAGKADTAQTLGLMEKYFQMEADTNLVAKDIATMAKFLEAETKEDSLVMASDTRAVALESDSGRFFSYYQKLAALTLSDK